MSVLSSWLRSQSDFLLCPVCYSTDIRCGWFQPIGATDSCDHVCTEMSLRKGQDPCCLNNLSWHLPANHLGKSYSWWVLLAWRWEDKRPRPGCLYRDAELSFSPLLTALFELVGFSVMVTSVWRLNKACQDVNSYFHSSWTRLLVCLVVTSSQMACFLSIHSSCSVSKISQQDPRQATQSLVWVERAWSLVDENMHCLYRLNKQHLPPMWAIIFEYLQMAIINKLHIYSNTQLNSL